MTMVTVALLVVGLLGFSRMKMELFPKVDFPIVVVNTIYPGAGPEQVETQVTAKLEEVINSISGIKHITSVSQESFSQIVVEFDLDVNSVTAAQDVREKVATVLNSLPADIEDPIVLRVDPAAAPIMSMVVSSEKLDQQTLTEYIKRVIKPRLETAAGVGQINLLGGSERQINVKVNLQKLNAFGLTMQDLAMKIQSANLEFPGGRFNEGSRELLVRTAGRYQTPEDMESLVVKTVGSQVVRLGDVADVEDGIVEPRTYSALNGQAAIGITVIKQSDANTVEAAGEVNKLLKDLTAQVERDGVKITLVDDTSVYIKQSVAAVEEDIIIGGILAVLIIYFFLVNAGSTFIAALAIPTSIRDFRKYIAQARHIGRLLRKRIGMRKDMREIGTGLLIPGCKGRDGCVNAIAKPEKVRGDCRIEPPTSAPKCDGRRVECMLNGFVQTVQLFKLQIRRQVIEHTIELRHPLPMRWRIPWMAMRPDLTFAGVRHASQDGCRAPIPDDRIGQEVGRHDPEFAEHSLQNGKAVHVVDRRIANRRDAPLILLHIDRHHQLHRRTSLHISRSAI